VSTPANHCRGAVRRRTLPIVALAFLAVAGCRVDVAVDVQVNADGSGTIEVVATVDADVVRDAPDLADDLRFADAEAQGWQVDRPAATDDGGLRVRLRREFDTVEQANVLLASLNGAGGPLQAVTLARADTGGEVTISVSGALRVDGGLNAFTDPDALTLLGGATPYAEKIAASGATPAEAVGITVSIDIGAGPQEYVVALDGSSVDIAASARAKAGDGGASALRTWLARLLLVLLALWVAVSVAFIAFVAVRRRQRAARRALQR
jgi:hypothetical protein